MIVSSSTGGLTGVGGSCHPGLRRLHAEGSRGKPRRPRQAAPPRIIAAERLRDLRHQRPERFGPWQRDGLAPFNNSLAAILADTELLLREAQGDAAIRRLKVIRDVAMEASVSVRRFHSSSALQK